jgi:hypothetical protein
MPSPFPGMDPFIEAQRWEDFHTRLIPALSDALVPAVRPHYVVQVEERVYVFHPPGQPSRFIYPDVAVADREDGERLPAGTGGTAVVVAKAAEVLTLPMPERRRELFLTLRDRENREVVTVIEVLSPTNKRSSSDGRREYLEKRDDILLSSAHLVELDLLRGGERLPTVERLTPADYYAFVSRHRRRPKVEVYRWTLRDRLREIPVPLAGEDTEVSLDLQAVFTTVYDRAGYDYSLDYRRPVEPPLSDADAAWVQEVLAAAGAPATGGPS